MNAKTIIIAMSAAFALSACASSSTHSESASKPACTKSKKNKEGCKWCASKKNCPSGVAGTSVTVEDTETGVSVVFATTEAANLEELRTRVQAAAQMKPKCEGKAKAEGGEKPDCSKKKACKWVKRTTTVENTETGAKMIMTPEKPEDLEALRAGSRKMAEWMTNPKSCTCEKKPADA